MIRLLLFIPLFFLLSCVDTDKMSAQIDGIKEENNEGIKEIVELVDSLRVIADAQEDTALCNAINDIATDIEYRLDDYSIEGMLDDLKWELVQ